MQTDFYPESQEFDMDSLARLQFDVRFINGQKLRFTANEIVQILYHKYTIAFYLATILIIIALRPHQQTDGLAGTGFVLLYFAIYILSFFNFAIMLVAAGWLMDMLRRPVVSVTAVQVTTTLINTWLASIAIASAGGGAISMEEMLLQWLMNSIIFEMAITGFGLQIVPRMLHDMRVGDQALGDEHLAELMEEQLQPYHVPAAPDAEANRWMPELEVNASEILRAEAQQNYVLIVTRNQRKLVRLPFQRFVSIVPEALGVRVHRSHWVAKAEIADFVTQDGKIFAQLRSGTRVPVSKQYQLDLLPDN